MQPLFHVADLRKGRVSLANQIYMVTTITRGRAPVFRDLWAGLILIRQLRVLEEQHRATTLAYVVMPDHLHWLFALGDNVSLATLVKSLKGVSSRHIPPLRWQRNFHDHAVRREEDVVALARYIIANPLRAGLVRTVREYPFWDAVWL